MEWNSEAIWSSAGLVLMLLGLLGSVIPVLPGPVLVFIGALVVAAGGEFRQIGWLTLAVLGVLTAAAWGVELLITTALTRRAGASWRTVGGAIVGGLVGGALFGAALTIVGGFFGAVIGAVFGVLFVERVMNRRAWPDAWRISRNYLAGCLLGRVMEFTLSALMVLIVLVQVVPRAWE